MLQQLKTKWWIFASVAAIIVSIIVLPKYVKQWMNTKTLRNDYLNHLFIVQHDYVYKATMQIGEMGVSVFMVKDADEKFDTWEPGTTANRINAAAFMLDSSGVCITSRYAAEPWKNNADITSITKLLSKNAGISEEMIQVSGMTVKLTIQSADQLSKSNANEIEYTVLEGKEDGNEIRYIGRTNNTGSLPVKKISLGDTYLNNLEKGSSLYALTYPDIDPGSGLPFETKVITLKVNRYQKDNDLYNYTGFEKQDAWLPEGAPVFDADLNLVGIYTSVNTKDQSNYICNLIRRGVNTFPESLQQIMNNQLYKTVINIPPDINLTSKDSAIIANVDKSIENAENASIFFPFGKKKGWNGIYETANLIYMISGENTGNAEKNETSPDQNFNGERSRIRVKARGMGSKLTILLLKKNDQDVFVEDKRFEIKEEGSIEQDLGILNGNYYIGILYNANQTIFRVAWEKEGE